MAPKTILALHGVAQSGPVFSRRCQSITTQLNHLGYTIHFLTAPHSIEGTAYTVARQADYQPGDLERSWWTTDDAAGSHPSIGVFIASVASAIREHGPFVGAMGFSQGGCAAASLCAMLEDARRGSEDSRRYLSDDVLAMQPPLEFLVLFSANPFRFPLSTGNDVDVRWLFYPDGFKAYPYEKLSVSTRESLTRQSTSLYKEAYPIAIQTPKDNRLCTPTLAFYGLKEWDLDPFSRGRQQWFISRFVDVTTCAHPWMHTVPRTEEYAKRVGEFVRVVGKRREDVKAVL